MSSFRVAIDRFRGAPTSALGHEATIVAARANWLALQLREPAMEHAHCTTTIREPWNKGKLVGQKAPFKLKEIWAIRVRLQLASRHRDLALFNLAIDSKLRACDLVKLRVRDVCHGGAMSSRAIVLQQKTQRPVQFEITEPTREAVGAWIDHAGLTSESTLFPSRLHGSAHLSTRQYARIVHSWVRQLGLDEAQLRDAHAQAHEGDLDLPPDQESAGRSAAARTHEAGEYGSLSRHRGQ